MLFLARCYGKFLLKQKSFSEYLGNLTKYMKTVNSIRKSIENWYRNCLKKMFMTLLTDVINFNILYFTVLVYKNCISITQPEGIKWLICLESARTVLKSTNIY